MRKSKKNPYHWSFGRMSGKTKKKAKNRSTTNNYDDDDDDDIGTMRYIQLFQVPIIITQQLSMDKKSNESFSLWPLILHWMIMIFFLFCFVFKNWKLYPVHRLFSRYNNTRATDDVFWSKTNKNEMKNEKNCKYSIWLFFPSLLNLTRLFMSKWS